MNETLLDGRFQLGKKIDTGGMAEVYAALDLKSDPPRAVAVKMMKDRKAASPEYRERFFREFQLGQLLQHPNIVSMFCSGSTDDGRPYYVMELLPGEHLGSIIEREGMVSQRRLLPMCEQILSAFTYFHGLNVVHRDLKPENIFIREDDSVVITDFGIARMKGDAPITATGITMGTPCYMAPEILMGKDADARSDIFALGLVTYEALTGIAPFKADRLEDVVNKIIEADVKPLAEALPGLAEGWDDFVDGCLAKDPRDRFENALEAMEALGPIRGQLGLPPKAVAHTLLSKHLQASAVRYTGRLDRGCVFRPWVVLGLVAGGFYLYCL